MRDDSYIVRDKNLIDTDLLSYLKRHEGKEMLRFLVAGSVDDGKSTLIGRLLYDSHLIYKDQLEAVYSDSKNFNTTNNEIDLSLLTDGLKAEREQGITIDVAYRYFSTEKKSFIICDAPGHEQYTRNMATGASHCDLAIILIDARNGVKEQTIRHSLIATLMGITHIVVAINKMDLVDYSKNVFDKIQHDYLAFSAKLNINTLTFIPISALMGDNVVDLSPEMGWFKGISLLNYLEEVKITNNRNLIDFRFPVQYVLRPNSEFRGYAGSVVSGIIRRGDEVVVLPSHTKTRIKSIETLNGPIDEAFVPMPVVLTVDSEVDISRGMVLAKPNNVPQTGKLFEAMLVWMDENPLSIGVEYLLKSNTQTVPVIINSIRYKFNLNELSRIETDRLNLNDIGRVEVLLQRSLVFDSFSLVPDMGSFILIDRNSNATAAGGIIINKLVSATSKDKFLSNEPSEVTLQQRELLLGHKPVTIWLTGLSGSGKSTIAKSVEAELLQQKIHACILDGDNLRHGLNSDLGFTADDRNENIRRVAQVAKLMNDAGLVVIVALIAPYSSSRTEAARILGNRYVEVFVDASIEVCQQRDPKGIYGKQKQGLVKGLTGIDSPYECPTAPDLHLQTEFESVEQSVERVLQLVLSKIK